jgi:uncharacterized protein
MYKPDESALPGRTGAQGGSRTQLKRHPERGSYERAELAAVIDAAPICHVAFCVDGEAIALPTAHARVDDNLYLHGAIKNRMLTALRAAGRASATFTLIDGLVLARTAFHHSMNFRSAVVFGSLQEVSDPDEKAFALHALVEHMAEGRMRELAPPSASELTATLVLRMSIEEGSVKMRKGPPLDGASDAALDVWAGVIPLALRAGGPVRDPRARPEQLLPPSAAKRAARDGTVAIERQHGDYLLSSDDSRLQRELVHRFLSEQSYWARGVSAAELDVSLEHSLCFGIYLGAQQVAFARVVSDRSRFAYLCDVFVTEAQRGRGLGQALIRFVLEHPHVRACKRVLLGTRDAHPFYERMGWQRDARGRFMELLLHEAG